MDPAFRDHRKNDWGHLMLRLDNATRDSNAGQIGAFLAKGWLLGTQRRAGGSSNRAVMVGDSQVDSPTRSGPAGPDWLRGGQLLEFASGLQIDQESAGQIPANMISSFLDDGDLRKLHRTLIKKKPPAPSVRRGRPPSAEWADNDPPQRRNHPYCISMIVRGRSSTTAWSKR
jgi:hypothetical protein